MPRSDQRSKGDSKGDSKGEKATSGRGGEAGKRSHRGPGRATPKATKQNVSGRYTPPIPREKRKSPAWHGVVLLFLLIGGLLLIVLNYVGVLPGGVHNYYLIIGILAMVVGLVMATFYH